MRLTVLPATFAALGCISVVAAHSWIDVLTIVGGVATSNIGTTGYTRNYHDHNDATSSYRIEDIAKTGLKVPVCAPFQGYNDYNPKFPKLAAAPGDYVSGLYTENGHITLPLKDASGAVIGMPGTMFWYGTTEVGLAPMLADVIAWTADGKGGNGKGKLLSGPTSYDDGVCAEDNPSPISAARGAQGKASIPCHSNFKLPESLKDGSTYTVYWVWDFSLKAGPGKDGKGDGHVEWYTSCMDIDIKGGPVVPASVAGGVTVGNKTLRSNRSVGGARLARLRRKVDFLH